MDLALFRAACTGQTVVAQQLLERGANVNYVNRNDLTEERMSVLQCAAYYQHLEMMSLLLEYGADRNTALALARRNGQASAVKILEGEPAEPTAIPPKPLRPAPSSASPPPPPIY